MTITVPPHLLFLETFEDISAERKDSTEVEGNKGDFFFNENSEISDSYW